MKKINNKILIFILLISIIPIPVFAACSQYCEDVAPAVRLVKIGLIPVLQIVIPIALILMAMLDLLKAVVAGREEEMKKAQSMLIKRAIYAVGLFFVMTIVHLSFDLFKITGADAEVEGTQMWWQCYSSVDECHDGDGVTSDDTSGGNGACYYCPNRSKYMWLNPNSRSRRNCTLHEEYTTEASCEDQNS